MARAGTSIYCEFNLDITCTPPLTSNVTTDPSYTDAVASGFFKHPLSERICILVRLLVLFSIMPIKVDVSRSQFLVLFGLSTGKRNRLSSNAGGLALVTVIHVWQSVKSRSWWLLPTVVAAGMLEIMGWSARLWLSKSPLALTPYEIQ